MHVSVSYPQLRKAIEDVNSGNMPEASSSGDGDDVDQQQQSSSGGGGTDEILSEKAVLDAQEKPLLGNNNNNHNNHSKTRAALSQQTTIDETITSIDSNLSNSDNCSDIELRFIDDVKGAEPGDCSKA